MSRRTTTDLSPNDVAVALATLPQAMRERDAKKASAYAAAAAVLSWFDPARHGQRPHPP